MKTFAHSTLLFSSLVSSLFITPTSGYSCTTLSFNNDTQTIYARNYDFPSGEGYVMVNRRNTKKVGLVPVSGPVPAQWTSQYGNVTFNQFGRELPLGGMNEAGLVVEVMVLDETDYGTYNTGEQALNEAQWIQYQLDNFSNVADMIAAQKDLRIVPFAMKLHYLACDRQKQCAIFEYLNGSAHINTGYDLTLNNKRIAVLANSTYQDSTAYLKNFQGFGGDQKLPEGPASLARFARAASHVQQEAKNMDPIEKAFAALQDVAQPGFTKWHIIYDQTAKAIAFQPVGFPARKWIYFADLDFSCKQPVVAIDINGDHIGNINSYWQPLTREDNLALLRKTVGTLPVKFPDEVVVKVASYPFAATKCQE